MTATRFIPTRKVRFIPTRKVRFKLDGGWRTGEVVAWTATGYRLRDSLTGFYFDVPAAACTDITNEVHSDE